MRCIAQSSSEPISVQIEQRGNLFDIWLRQNIEEKETDVDDEKITYWEYDEVYMENPYSPLINENNFDVWFEKASAWNKGSDDYSEEDLILELAADHEERLCMLEMLVEV